MSEIRGGQKAVVQELFKMQKMVVSQVVDYGVSLEFTLLGKQVSAGQKRKHFPLPTIALTLEQAQALVDGVQTAIDKEKFDSSLRSKLRQ